MRVERACRGEGWRASASASASACLRQLHTERCSGRLPVLPDELLSLPTASKQQTLPTGYTLLHHNHNLRHSLFVSAIMVASLPTHMHNHNHNHMLGIGESWQTIACLSTWGCHTATSSPICLQAPTVSYMYIEQTHFGKAVSVSR